jgi:hypothetical protein
VFGLVVVVAGPSLAFAPDAPTRSEAPLVSAPASPDIEAVLRRAASPGDAGTTLMERISQRLRKLPLRPVMIGEEPRTPDDPEPGAGLTIFIRF